MFDLDVLFVDVFGFAFCFCLWFSLFLHVSCSSSTSAQGSQGTAVVPPDQVLWSVPFRSRQGHVRFVSLFAFWAPRVVISQVRVDGVYIFFFAVLLDQSFLEVFYFATFPDHLVFNGMVSILGLFWGSRVVIPWAMKVYLAVPS